MQVKRNVEDIKQEVKALFAERLDAFFAEHTQQGFDQRRSELAVLQIMMVVGRLMLSCLWMLACWRKTEEELCAKGLRVEDVQLRLGASEYQRRVMTTLGPVAFPLCAYRQAKEGGGRGKTCVPARQLLALDDVCRSSPLCLEWEIRFGAEHPFRAAQEELGFVTHGATSVEDTTIARHLVHAAAALERQWLYRTPKEIRKLLRERAVRDRKNGKPIVHISCDAHALRRYIGETWQADWKMSNGIRVWCIDQETGETLHVGGEYTWGDCRHVRTLFEDLIDRGILPANGDYGEGVCAQLVWISDGMPWFEDHLLPLFEREAIEVVLDLPHLLERIATYAAALYGKGSAKASTWYAEVKYTLTGEEPQARPDAKAFVARKGHTKRRRSTTAPATPRPHEEEPEPELTPLALIDLIAATEQDIHDEKARQAHKDLLDYVLANGYRIDYAMYRYRGFQIGSGAMESIHRTASQLRLKRPGLRCLAETAQAILHWRMLKYVGRWEEFWNQTDLAQQIAKHWKSSCIDYTLEEAA